MESGNREEGFGQFYSPNLSHLLPPAMQLGQGNVFTGVCHSFCPGGGWLLSMHHRSYDQRVCFQGDLLPGVGDLPLRSSAFRVVCLQRVGGDLPPGVVGWADPLPPQDTWDIMVSASDPAAG